MGCIILFGRTGFLGLLAVIALLYGPRISGATFSGSILGGSSLNYGTAFLVGMLIIIAALAVRARSH